jgi:glycosyltransferase involved in cell wall biosynthesis
MGRPSIAPNRRVALVINGLAAGGLERQALTLAKHLGEDHRIDLELIHLKNEGSLVLDPVALSLKTWSPKFNSGLDLSGAVRLGAYLKQRGFEVAIAYNQYATLMTVLARCLCSVRMQVYSAFHSVPDGIGGGLRDRARLELYDHCLSYCEGLVYVSQKQKDAWTARGFARRVHAAVITNGIDPSLYWPPPDSTIRVDLGWSPAEFVVGLCAALRPEKRVEDLVEAAAIAIARGIPLRLLIIGDGPRRDQIAARIEQTLPAGAARMVGFQSDVAQFVHACDVMALVSDAEAFSLSVLEAMACGKPVVLTDVGGATEQIESGRHGYVVPTRSPAVVAERLEQIWRDGEAEALGEAARTRLRSEFSVQAMTARYAELLLPSGPDFAPQHGVSIENAS